ncbi:hypothetical protein [Ralstonia flatus]|uniref:Uncharacterized protein n=1 Tax=Ralstonia flatus TaxID=3058601 RepID=A0AAD2C0N9_9RALS|nr:hypothetical protein [Ralstonia sp. LMG 32965]CAJ0881424.1 hypothetical protein R77567_03387 [Ralstonia sp. LMG 32965]CAJ0892977.1 hypothetical protein R77564_03674 [Ralstonia sp. LMG 32965]
MTTHANGAIVERDLPDGAIRFDVYEDGKVAGTALSLEDALGILAKLKLKRLRASAVEGERPQPPAGTVEPVEEEDDDWPPRPDMYR